MVDKKVKCIAKNYSVDEETKAGITMTDKQGTLSFDAPNDPLDPVFIHKSGQQHQSRDQQRLLDSDDSDESNS